MHGKIWKLRFFYVLGKWMYRCWLMDAWFRKDVFFFFCGTFFQTRSPIPKHPIAKSQIDVWKSMFIDGKHMHRWRSGVVCTWKMYVFCLKKVHQVALKTIYIRTKKTNFNACFLKNWKEKTTFNPMDVRPRLGCWFGFSLVLFGCVLCFWCWV